MTTRSPGSDRLVFPYPRLYLRLALYIGAALAVFVLLGAASLALIASYELRGYSLARQSPLAKDAAVILARDGKSGLREWLANGVIENDDFTVFVLNQNSQDLLDRPLPMGLEDFVRESVVARPESTGENYMPVRLAPQLVAPDGEILTFLVLPKGISLWGSPATLFGLIVTALLVTGAIAWLIARIFGRPIVELQRAVRDLASGHADARVPAVIARRTDELGALAADFNRMSRKLNALIVGREQLMQELSHELRAPLARLQAALALAGARNSLTMAEREQVDTEIGRMDKVIGELLRFSRLNTVDVVARRLIRLDALLTDLVETEKVESAARGCRLTLESDAALTMVGDPELLKRGFENILRNAIRFAPRGSEVELAARRGRKGISVTVSDRGPGVPEGYLEQIFEPFVRAPGVAEGGQSSGLGLAIARRVFELHDGSVEALARAGGGLIIRVNLLEAKLQ
ncbi:MAG: HAMP domain-containing protein [Gammaproteobacteria bacterium]|nr:HAMP domain-containing protein [Gammaproteobacteria bacterium]MBT8444607.1 HAMP domain-containing protein [Gammaproteobacteria bacterium]